MRLVAGSALLVYASARLRIDPRITDTISSAFLAGCGLLLIPGLWTPIFTLYQGDRGDLDDPRGGTSGVELEKRNLLTISSTTTRVMSGKFLNLASVRRRGAFIVRQRVADIK
jgi:hypothetical protein